MKSTILLLLLFPMLACFSQNVGIGNSNPTEKLHVTGNINVTGTIKANGVDGTANQVLMKNNSGIMEWGDIAEFKNFLSFYSSATFTVPAGITKLKVELWGAGGGGNFYCGGGGGGYVCAQIMVQPGDVCTITIGNGGLNATGATAGNGGNTSITAGTEQYIATGGRGATYVSSTFYNPGVGGAAAYSASARSYIVIPGERGGYQTKRYDQYSTTVFYVTTIGGKGGATFKYPDAGGDASHNLSESTEPTTKMTNTSGTDGKVPGGGGASGLVSAASVSAGSGAKGMAIIYY